MEEDNPCIYKPKVKEIIDNIEKDALGIGLHEQTRKVIERLRSELKIKK